MIPIGSDQLLFQAPEEFELKKKPTIAIADGFFQNRRRIAVKTLAGLGPQFPRFDQVAQNGGRLMGIR